MAGDKATDLEVFRAMLDETEYARDALPYTPEFDRLHRLFEERSGRSASRAELWHGIVTQAKRGGWKGKRRGDPPPKLTVAQSDILRGLLKGRLGQRDKLPYTADFDTLVKAFNESTGLQASAHDVWRLSANLSKHGLKAEVKALLDSSIASLILGIEHFNRPSELGRSSSVLILLDHAIELLLKAALVHRGASIRETKNGHTLTLSTCTNRATDDGTVKFMKEDERRTILVLNGLRDQAQHHLVSVSEQMLYSVAQSAVSLHGDLLGRVFDQSLAEHVPERVLPISTSPPKDIAILMDHEFSQLKDLMRKGQKASVEAEAKLRSLLAVDRALKAEPTHVGHEELESIRDAIKKENKWASVFAGIAQIEMNTVGTGINVSIHLTKREGVPVRLVSPGEAVAGMPVAIRKVSDTDFYCFGARDVAGKVGLSEPKVLALIQHLQVRQDLQCFKEIPIGKSRFKRYSAEAVKKIQDAIPNVDIEKVWRQHKPVRKQRL